MNRTREVNYNNLVYLNVKQPPPSESITNSWHYFNTLLAICQ
jgi:hypothetical protein